MCFDIFIEYFLCSISINHEKIYPFPWIYFFMVNTDIQKKSDLEDPPFQKNYKNEHYFICSLSNLLNVFDKNFQKSNLYLLIYKKIETTDFFF